MSETHSQSVSLAHRFISLAFDWTTTNKTGRIFWMQTMILLTSDARQSHWCLFLTFHHWNGEISACIPHETSFSWASYRFAGRIILMLSLLHESFSVIICSLCHSIFLFLVLVDVTCDCVLFSVDLFVIQMALFGLMSRALVCDLFLSLSLSLSFFLSFNVNFCWDFDLIFFKECVHFVIIIAPINWHK